MASRPEARPRSEPPSAPAKLPVAADFPAFVPRLPWLGGDLQTLRNIIVQRRADLSSWPGQRLILDLDDGSGDRLAAMLNRPADAAGRPLVILVHGLTGCEDSFHILSAAASYLRQGYPVLRVNLRGAGPSAPYCSERYHAGRSEDLRASLRSLQRDSPALLKNGLVVMGSSLGANMLARFLAESAAEFPLHAGVLVCAPIDLKAAQERIMRPRNAVYHSYLLRRMKQECLAESVSLTEAERSALAAVRNVYEFDDLFVAPRGGFDSADDYYDRCSARRFLPSVGIPTLVIASHNDPWIPFGSYEAFDWSCNANLLTLFPAGGGHVGFHERGTRTAWFERCALRFLEAVLD